VRSSRRSYAEVLAKTFPPLEESFGVYSGPIARVPRWAKELFAGVSTYKSVQDPTIFKRSTQAPANNSIFPAGAGMASEKMTQALVKSCTLSCGLEVSVKPTEKGWEGTDMHVHFG
jgi:hypothetical protein